MPIPPSYPLAPSTLTTITIITITITIIGRMEAPATAAVVAVGVGIGATTTSSLCSRAPTRDTIGEVGMGQNLIITEMERASRFITVMEGGMVVMMWATIARHSCKRFPPEPLWIAG